MQQLSGNVPTTDAPSRSSGTGPGAEAITTAVTGLDLASISGKCSATAAKEVSNA